MATSPTQLTPKQQAFLEQVRAWGTVNSLRQFCQAQEIEFNFAKGFCLSGLVTDWLTVEEQADAQWHLTPKGRQRSAAAAPVPGCTLAELLAQGVTQMAELQEQLGDEFAGEFSVLQQIGAVICDATTAGGASLSIANRAALDRLSTAQTLFQTLQRGPLPPELDPSTNPNASTDQEALQWLQSQGLASLQGESDYRLVPRSALEDLVFSPGVTTLTSEMLLSQSWREATFKPYNIQDAVPNIPYGRPSILGECIQRIRDLFLNMGFDEMAGSIVESAFWNFDALFTPQDHPARDEQDTFYVDRPALLPLPEDPELIQRVQATHEQHYGNGWTAIEASRALLRAHTTPFTVRKLYETQGQPGKYFSIDRVFRNENLDRTHLAEFHQIEGVVIGEMLSIRSLMGYLSYFYEQLGFQDLKFKPTYNPYTEPSLEVYAYHGPSESYLEVGNSGMFRREMLEPLGCGEVSAIAWGLGLERIAMLLYGVDRLGDLIGPESRLDR
ncbi:MAG: phenylalanine--tRNA ligase subunit alpha [Prochlorothrix sp.]|nr:phenylalanine--tRNA ligase subunit alpha [Prochlorothrix sp.]